MTRQVTFAGTLFFCDGIQVFECRDHIGGHYIGVAIERVGNSDTAYALFGVAPADLQQFRIGKLDLRSLIVSRGDSSWFIIDELDTDGSIINFADEQDGAVLENYLPADGFFIGGSFEPDTQWVRMESQARNKLALEVTLESLVPSDEHRIGANALGSALLHIQSLVKNAYQKALSLGLVADTSDRETVPLLDVAVPAAPGSFRVLLMPSKDETNLFGASELGKALDSIDYLLGDISNLEETLRRVKTYSGRTAGSLVRLLTFLNDSNVTLKYSWTAPDREKVSTRSISRTDTMLVLLKLLSAERVGVEKRTIIGKLRRVNLDFGMWGIRSAEDGKIYTGKTREGIGLDHLITDDSYVFECEEVTEEITGTGQEIRTLYLSSSPLPVRT